MSIWKYLSTWFNGKAQEKMDPKVQIEQVVEYHEKQDRSLREQAAVVIGNRNTIRLRHGRAIKAAEDLKAKATSYAQKAQTETDSDKRAKLERHAQQVAMDLISKEQQVADMTANLSVMDEQSKAAQQMVTRNSLTLRKVTNEKMQLLSKIDQTRMQEEVNKALGIAGRPLDIPTFDTIEENIEKRYGLATAHAELNEGTLFEADHEMDMLADEATARLDELLVQKQLTEGS